MTESWTVLFDGTLGSLLNELFDGQSVQWNAGHLSEDWTILCGLHDTGLLETVSSRRTQFGQIKGLIIDIVFAVFGQIWWMLFDGCPENVCSSREDSTSIPYPCPNRSGRGVGNTPLCKPRKGREKKNLPTYLMDDLFDGTMGMDYYYGYRLSYTGIHLDTLRQNHEILFQIQTGLFKTVSSRRDSNWPN